MLNDGRIVAHAPAKLNLTLHVGPIGPDGYHPLDSVVAKITLYDELAFTPRQDGRLSLTCQTPLLDRADNLVLRAARALQRAGAQGGADIVLHKRIPLGAGLGGGSADAAATLRALNRLWDCRLGDEQLSTLAARLGADVPLFLGPPACRMRGRGEQLTGLSLPFFAAVLVTPPLHSSTADVYRAYDAMGPVSLDPFDTAPLLAGRPSQWHPLLRNDLLAPAVQISPAVGQWSARLRAATDLPVHMTGSGCSLFILADDVHQAEGILGRLDRTGMPTACIVTLNPW